MRGARCALALVAVTACNVPATRFTGPGAGDDTGAPTLDIAVASYDFGTVMTGTQSAPTMFMFHNGHDTASPVLLPATLTGAGAVLFELGVDGCAGRTLQPGDSCTVAALMAPSSEGVGRAALAVTTAQGGGATVMLSGTAVAPGALQLSPSTATFDPLSPDTVSPAAMFTATNTGSTPTGKITAGLSGSDASQFAIASDSCTGATLAPHAACTIKLRFAPQSPGSKVASLTVTSAAAGTGIATLGGRALQPAMIAVTPPSNDFGPVVTSRVSATAVFTARNTGELPTSALTTGLTGAADQYQLSADTCNGKTLAAGASCMVTVAFAPTATGRQEAQLALTASEASAMAALAGTGIPPAALAFTPTSNNFGMVDVGSTSSAMLTLTNNGGQTSSAIATSLSGFNASELSITNDGCAGRTLAPGASCSLVVAFTPTSSGLKSATLQATAAVGGLTVASLSGTGRDKVTLTIATNGGSGTGTVTCDNAACASQYYRDTQIMLTANPDPGMQFSRWTGACSGTSSSCTITLAGDTTVTAVFLAQTQDLTIATSGVDGATGTIATSPAGTPCGTGCLRFPTNTLVTLTAIPTALPANSYLAAWSGHCYGNGLTCQLFMSGAHSAAAQYSPANRAFVTSGVYWPDPTVGPPEVWADATCQGVAQMANLSGHYVGYLGSSAATSWLTRLGNAAGWVRRDDKPFAAAQSDVTIFDGVSPLPHTLYPLNIDEHGMTVPPDTFVLSGRYGHDCMGWTNSGQMYPGLASAAWLGAGTFDTASAFLPTTCGTKLHLYCLGTDYNVNLSYPHAAGRTAFVITSVGFNYGGVAEIDRLCAQHASDAGLVGTFKALVSTTTASAASRFSTMGPPWVRPDGIPIVASAADLFAPGGGPLMIAALDIDQSGQPTSGSMTTGGTSLLSTSPATLNCNDFTTGPGGTYQVAIGSSDYSNALMVSTQDRTTGLPTVSGCTNPLPAGFYCLQQ
jgi:hypothetical protein